MSDKCGDNRFEIIEKAKQDLLESTNISSSEDEIKVLDSFLFRCWQMGWLNKYDTESKKKLVIIMDSKEGDTKHICNQEACPFYSKTEDGDIGILCKKLWATPPKGKSSLASLCNYYDVQKLTIAEAKGCETINQILEQ